MAEEVRCPKCGKPMENDLVIMGFDKIYEKYKCSCGATESRLIIWTGCKWKTPKEVMENGT